MNHMIAFRRLLSSFSLRRSVLYVPGNDAKKIQKVSQVRPDCVILDLEDGVALNKKLEARQLVSNHDKQFGLSECFVRVNACDSDFVEEDLREVLTSRYPPTSLMVPKLDTAEQLRFIADRAKRHRPSPPEPISLIVYTETARGLLNLSQICKEAMAWNSVSSFPLRLEGVVFGSDDYCADLGIERQPAGRGVSLSHLLYARQKIVTCTSAFGLQAIDVVFIDFKDEEGLRNECLDGVRCGFSGKQLIHPSQVRPTEEIFSPSAARVEAARALMNAFREHQASGKGAFVHGGRMIDKPLLLQAENIDRLSREIDKRNAAMSS